jgi:hypothetical protein
MGAHFLSDVTIAAFMHARDVSSLQTVFTG